MGKELLVEDLITVADVNEDVLVSGRDLHNYLEIGTPYVKWIKRMFEYGFDESIDYLVTDIFVPNSKGGLQTQVDHHLKLDMAKEVAMVQRTEKGKAARQHFIQTEKDLVIQREENLRLALANEELHKIATSDKEQKEREYQADKIRYSWNNMRTVLENCDYKTIEDEVAKVITFHSEELKKRDRANHKYLTEANNTEYKQAVRDRVFNILDEITNTTLDGVLRAVASELRVNVIKDKLQTTNRSTSRIQSNLERMYEAVKPPELSEYHVLNHHSFSLNYMYETVENSSGKLYERKTKAYENWLTKMPWYELPRKLNVDFSKPIKLHLAFEHKEGHDLDNMQKSIQDYIFEKYGIDDSIVAERPSLKTVDYVNDYTEGKIYFLLENV